MEFLKKIFLTKTKDKDIPLPERYPENSIGDFYVENQVCITCGAPEAEAPDLIEHSKLEYGHCYFKKQPTTANELDRAINAMQVSCIEGIRYGGKDKAILKRLYDLGLQAECDYKLEDLE
ncbi:ferredoxin [Pedobacter sp. ISL-68]|uniref:ferredoxin n=1 Tax=unclassified Pedobacter TaxID=2628915 RepID=UPI001BE757C8|nr:MULTISPECIES: ferredoxin [unclassified Pedobacter]MBT2563924.1 ferredoxin [Pedobacter sp. ISL-64]MBT2592670.1 ferredoxin [Pedobacter sp. ISL-68]